MMASIKRRTHLALFLETTSNFCAMIIEKQGGVETKKNSGSGKF